MWKFRIIYISWNKKHLCFNDYFTDTKKRDNMTYTLALYIFLVRWHETNFSTFHIIVIMYYEKQPRTIQAQGVINLTFVRKEIRMSLHIIMKNEVINGLLYFSSQALLLIFFWWRWSSFQMSGDPFIVRPTAPHYKRSVLCFI